MNTTTSPYEAPREELLMESDEPGEIRFFSPNCRIGRLRYLAHGALIGIGFYLILGIAALLTFGLGESTAGSVLFWVICTIAYVALLGVSAVVMVQRLHDQDLSGWLWLLIFVPIANLVITVMLLFIPGTDKANKYGSPPPPNKTWHWIVGLIMPFVFFIGIFAAIALPAYQSYVERAAGFSDDGAMIQIHAEQRQRV